VRRPFLDRGLTDPGPFLPLDEMGRWNWDPTGPGGTGSSASDLRLRTGRMQHKDSWRSAPRVELVGHEIQSGSYGASPRDYLRLPALTPNALRKAR
jgi:hypothetical protein